MFWQFIISAIIAIAFIRLGALSVWVSVLSLSLKILLVVAFGAGLLFLWQRFRA